MFFSGDLYLSQWFIVNEKPFERQKAGIPDPNTVSYYHNGTFQSVCHHYGAKAGDSAFQEAFERYKTNQEQFPASPWNRNKVVDGCCWRTSSTPL